VVVQTHRPIRTRRHRVRSRFGLTLVAVNLATFGLAVAQGIKEAREHAARAQLDATAKQLSAQALLLLHEG
jgi:hypothetical protein